MQVYSYRFVLTIGLMTGMLWLSSCGSSRHATKSDKQQPSVKTETPPPYRRLSEKELKRKYASMLETSPKQIRNKSLYYFIDEWWGTRYKYGGNDRNGVDCSGFSTQLYRQVYEVPIKRTSNLQYETTRRIKKVKHLEEGDLLFFGTPSSKNISHVGVYLQNDYFVHSASGKGVSISNLHDAYWEKCFVAGGRVK